MAEKQPQGPVERATRAELRAWGVSVQTKAKAAMAVALARQADAAKGGTSKADAAAHSHRQLMDDLEKSAARPERDEIDELIAEPAKLRVVGSA